ncbi:MAG: zinc-dependent metalloprotease, partial [Bradymonadaceae bacterium]
KNLVAFSLPNQLNGSNPAKYYSQANQGGPDAFYDEHGDVDDDSSSELSYFDFTVKVSANPCFSRERQAQGSTGVCSRGQRFPGRVSHPGQAEVEIRSSFSRIKHGRRDYQPVYYGDEKMTKFGFFRTNRPVYDKRKGFTDEGAIRLANRFDIWKNDFKRTEDGSFEEDAAGHRIPVPMPERKPKPVVYHLSPDFPDSLMPSAQKIESDYNKAFKRVVAAAKYGVDDPSKVDQKMFYVCQNPVPKDAPEACDPRPLDKRVGSDGTYEPYRARPGDLRRNFIYLVREPAAGGLLGFGPSFADPETGEIISGTAYVYGAAVNRKADEAVNVVKLLNDDLSREAAYEGEDIENYIRNHLKQGIDPRANMGKEMFSKLKNIGLDQLDEALLDKGQRQRLRQLRQSNWKERLKVPSNFQSKQYEELQKHGFDQLVLNDELIWGMSGGQVPPNRQKVSAKKVRKLLKKQNPFKPSSILHSEQQPWKQYARQNMYHEDFMFGAVFGLAKEYDKKNVDYQKVYNEIRNEVFRGVMVHELGHTVGLRHNFAGSYDSVNYHDEYWNMRKQNFGIPNSLAGFWEKSNMTEKQRKGEMPKYMYSSIMDYHSRFNGDMAGLGKYDVAALRFAYTTGTYSNVKASNRDPIPTKAGYVEVFKDVPKSVNLPQYQSPRKPRQIMYSYDDRYAPWEHPLTDYHYTSLVKMLGGVENLDDRELMRYSKLRKKQKNNVEGRPVEVQYMMCSDEYAGFSVDCNPWDLGAGPFEITKWAVRKYEDYYPFTHFRRDRLDFGINSALRSSSRVFRQFPNIYQRWILHRFRSFRNDDSD